MTESVILSFRLLGFKLRVKLKVGGGNGVLDSERFVSDSVLPYLDFEIYFLKKGKSCPGNV